MTPRKNNNKEWETKSHFYKMHLDRQPGLRGRKLERLSLSENLLALGRKLGIKITIER